MKLIVRQLGIYAKNVQLQEKLFSGEESTITNYETKASKIENSIEIEEEPNGSKLPTRSPKILIVDDEEIVHLVLRRLLEGEEVVIDSAFGGREALLKVSPDYDLVICDVRMPDIDGIQVLTEIKKRELDTIVIIVTGYASEESLREAMNNGASDYIKKPFENIPDLREKIRGAITQAVTTRGKR